MKHSGILALSAPLLASIATAKPMNHQHLHKRAATVTVTVDIVQTVHSTILEYLNSKPSATLITTGSAHSGASQPTSDLSQPQISTGPHSNPQPPAPSTPPQSPAPTTPSQSVQQDGGALSPDEWQRKQGEIQASFERLQASYIAQQQAQTTPSPAPTGQQYQPPAPPTQQTSSPVSPPQEEKVKIQPGSSASNNNGGGSNSGGGSSGGSCGQINSKCTASDVTIYNDQGTGACGWQNDTNSEDFFALAYTQWKSSFTNDAPGPHKNPWCGRMATINVNGNKVSGMLTDKCPGCTGWSIDLSQSLWNKVYNREAPTRKHDVEWWFTSPEIYTLP